jgi:nucleoside-diphosphate-sugar epimerase
MDLRESPSKVVFDKSIEGSHVTHLAGIVGESLVRANPKLAREVNVNGAIRLATKLLELNLARFTYVSTCHVYAKSDKPIKEDWDLDPISEYASQKLETELLLTNLFKNTNTELTILRVFSILDSNVKDFTLGGTIKKAIKDDGKNPIRCGDDVRDFLTPCSTAMIIERIAQTPSMGGTWNICTGIGVSVRAAGIRMLGPVANEKIKDIFQPGFSGVPYLVGNNEKLLNKLPGELFEWTPKPFVTVDKDIEN